MSLIDWIPRSRPDRAIVDGLYIRLEPLNASRHGDELFEAGGGPDREALWRYLADHPFSDRTSFELWLARAAASEDPLFFAVIERDTGRAEGRLALMRIDPANGVIEVGNILFGPRLARSRGATEAIFLLARWVFDGMGYRRFEWKCDNRNEPSKRAAVRFGFSYEGLFRQHMVVKGESRDTAWFAMTDQDWQSRKAAYAQWLSPLNFDAMGHQVQALSSLMNSATT
jgi:RimJ/RimL family protein N-acetyltransferase